ncbi:MAG TPA: hypothetical protein VHL09_12215 [Dehalococcoidia bacterium]|nr:hypothetical protein [Dehalococcoidia bacterium]
MDTALESVQQVEDDLTVTLCTLDVVQQQGHLSPKLADFIRRAKLRLGRVSRYVASR